MNRFRVKFPGELFDGNFGYVFFTKPQLNIFKEGSFGKEVISKVAQLPEFNLLLNTHPDLFINLQSGQGNGNFILPLTNAVRNFPTKDEIIKTREGTETANDWKVVYGHRKNDSRAADTIDLSFLDDRNLNVFNTIKIWVNYIHYITIGEIEPSLINKHNRIVDYMGSIYYFLTDETATNIVYWCKLVGVFPLNVPSSAYSWEIGNLNVQKEYSVSFQYFCKDESPSVITDFNNICGTKYRYDQFSELYDKSDGLPPKTWCKGVNIYTHDTTEGRQYKLRFVE